MDDTQAACIGGLLDRARGCSKILGLASTEMGDATLPTATEVGCPAMDPGVLGSVDMFARAGESVGSSQCAARAAQALCGVGSKGVDLRAEATTAPGTKGDEQSASQTDRCLCLAIQRCNALVTAHL